MQEINMLRDYYNLLKLQTAARREQQEGGRGMLATRA